MMIKVKIDHVGIINNNFSICKSVFEKLGFCSGEITQLDTGLKGDTNAPVNLHYVFDNTYIECITTTGNDYLANYLNSNAALHTVVLATDNLAKTKQNLNDIVNVSEIMKASRDADHGAIKGKAIFLWMQINEEVICNTLLGVVEHQTPDLIYQKEKYLHENGTTKINALIVKYQNERFIHKLKEIDDGLELSDKFENKIDELKYQNEAEILKDYGVDVSKTKSPYCGIEFISQDLNKIEKYVKNAKKNITF